MLQRLQPKQRDVNANSGATWQSLGTSRCDCMEFHWRTHVLLTNKTESGMQWFVTPWCNMLF